MYKPTRAIPIPGTRTWLDTTDHSSVTVCAICGRLDGPYPRHTAEAAAWSHHNTSHPHITGWTTAETVRLSPCSKRDCTAPVVAKGKCMKHYQQDRRKALA